MASAARLRVVVLAVLGVAGTLASATLSQAAWKAENQALVEAAEARAQAYAADLSRELGNRLLATERMADRWRVAGGLSHEAWRADAGNSVSDFAGVRVIERIDADGRVEAVVPENYGGLVGVDLRAEPARRAALDEAWARKRTTVSTPVHLYSGGLGILSFTPLYVASRFDGWIGAVFPVEYLVDVVIGPHEGWQLAIRSTELPLYVEPGPASPFCAEALVGVFYLGWSIRACAGPQVIDRFRGPLPYAAFALGVAATLLVGGLFSSLLQASERERQARSLAARLQEQAESVERAQRELAEVSWTVSHELRAPLRAIDGYAAILAQDCSEDHLIERIRAAARRMTWQLDGLLELLRVARAPVRPAHVDVTALADEALARHASIEPGRTVVGEVERRIFVVTDPTLAAVIVDVLIDNAWKFTQGREPAHIRVRAAPGGFVVEDDGVGFDPAFAAKLFAPFERLHGAEVPGLGVGLAVAARAAGRLGGRIHADGAPGVGARFVVELPQSGEGG